LTSKERIYDVLLGRIPERVPVSLYKIDPFDENSFWAQHKSFSKLLETARDLQDTFFFYKLKTGFFFSSPELIEIKVEEYQDTPISKTIKITAITELGPLTRIARTSNMSMHQWVQKPWIESEKDIHKFLSLPYSPYTPDISEFYKLQEKIGDKGIIVVALPDPLGVVGFLFAPGDFSKFAIDYPDLIHKLLDKIYERLINIYTFISKNVENVIIRIRGAEYATPPTLPEEYFNIKKAFWDFVIRYDTHLIEILKRGKKNYICYHWHDHIDDLISYVMKLGINIIEPISNTFEKPNFILKIRKIVGNEVVIMGGVDAIDMEFKTPEEITQLVKETIIQGGRKGRFILIPSDIPESAPLTPELERNYITFLQAAIQYGKYPL